MDEYFSAMKILLTTADKEENTHREYDSIVGVTAVWHTIAIVNYLQNVIHLRDGCDGFYTK